MHIDSVIFLFFFFPIKLNVTSSTGIRQFDSSTYPQVWETCCEFNLSAYILGVFASYFSKYLFEGLTSLFGSVIN